MFEPPCVSALLWSSAPSVAALFYDSWLAGWLVGWCLGGWLDRLRGGRLIGWLFGWLVG